MGVLRLPPEWMTGWCEGASVMRGYVGDLIFLLDKNERPVGLDIYRGWAYLNLKPGEIGGIDFPVIGGHQTRKGSAE